MQACVLWLTQHVHIVNYPVHGLPVILEIVRSQRRKNKLRLLFLVCCFHVFVVADSCLMFAVHTVF